jgi:GNAT superfamily N-acetyltransferase
VTIAIRRAGPGDAEAAAELWLRARRAATGAIPAPVHTDAEVREWFASHVLPRCELWLAEDEDGGLAGILVLEGEWLEQLYVDPERTGRGIGSRLLDLAKRERPDGLKLWAFVSNVGAQRFYERHGFAEQERTDGSGNEERSPDILYAWP